MDVDITKKYVAVKHHIRTVNGKVVRVRAHLRRFNSCHRKTTTEV